MIKVSYSILENFEFDYSVILIVFSYCLFMKDYIKISIVCLFIIFLKFKLE